MQVAFRGEQLRWDILQPLHGTTLGDAVPAPAVQVPMARSPGKVRHKSPALAWFLSFLLPGGGQAYNGQWGKAAAFFGGTVVGLAINSTDECGDYVCFGAGFWVAMAAAVGSQIDAPVAASAINRKAQRAAYRSAPVSINLATIHF